MKTGSITGEYGQIVEHPMLRGLEYMVTGYSRTTTDGHRWFNHYKAIVIRDDAGMSKQRITGEVVEISEDGWLLHDD
jgi:hypothetical protein